MIYGLDILKNLSILYAEDDKTVREATAKTLSVFFKTVITVDNGADAINIYNKKKPNIVMLDIGMPLMNGLEVASSIRKNDQTTPIIINTSYQETDDFLKAIKLNLTDYIIKPFSFEKLQIALMEAIDKLHKNGLLIRKIIDDVEYDFVNKKIIRFNETILLTKNESILFEELLKQQGSLVTYQKLEEVLGSEFSESRAGIKNTILRIRKKAGKELILNIQDFGYLLR